MATWRPDPTFYPSPRMAMKAPAETLAYVASFDPTRRVPDAISVVDVDPASVTYSQVVGTVAAGDPHGLQIEKQVTIGLGGARGEQARQQIAHLDFDVLAKDPGDFVAGRLESAKQAMSCQGMYKRPVPRNLSSSERYSNSFSAARST